MANEEDITKESANEQTQRPKRRQPIKLPFDNRKTDAIEWAYLHRIGLFVLLAAYFALGMAFISSKVSVGSKPSAQGFVIDLSNIELLEQRKEQLEAEVRARQAEADWRSIRNVSSNENSLNEKLKDDRGTNTAALNSSAEATEARMRANREAYERGLAEAYAAGERTDEGKKDKEQENARVKGNVTVSFSFKDPVRNGVSVFVPAYKCEGGGEVVVSATLNQQGKVVAAQVLSGGDECMRQTAIAAAKRSLFSADSKAPFRQTGTITYLFIPQ